jgi:hypothetical protein
MHLRKLGVAFVEFTIGLSRGMNCDLMFRIKELGGFSATCMDRNDANLKMRHLNYKHLLGGFPDPFGGGVQSTS